MLKAGLELLLESLESPSYISFYIEACSIEDKWPVFPLFLRLHWIHIIVRYAFTLLVYQFSRLLSLYTEAFTISWSGWSLSLRHLRSALRGNKLLPLGHSWSRKEVENLHDGPGVHCVCVLRTHCIMGGLPPAWSMPEISKSVSIKFYIGNSKNLISIFIDLM